MFYAQGSANGPWQIQHYDDASDVPGAVQLEGDQAAWNIVLAGTESHHEAARQFVRAHCPQEWAAMNGQKPAAEAVLAEQADRAYAEYDFGKGVEVTDASGWEYTAPGVERTCKVYVETEREDDGPAPAWTLNFTVRCDPFTGGLVEAYALDSKGQMWGAMPTASNATEAVAQASDGVAAGPAGLPDVDAAAGTRLADLFAPYELALAGVGDDPESVGLVIDDTVITDPTLSECGRFSVDPSAAYGLSAPQVRALKGLNELVEGAVHAALDAGCAHLQEALEIPSGDLAGLHFSGVSSRHAIAQSLGGYLISEIVAGDALVPTRETSPPPKTPGAGTAADARAAHAGKQKFRVLGAHPEGNFFDIEVEAEDGLRAFGAAALLLKEAGEDGAASFFAAVPGGVEYELPGESVVVLETVLDPEQADVFGLENIDNDQDHPRERAR